MQFFKTIYRFFNNPFVNPYKALGKHIKWQVIKVFRMFPQDIILTDNLKVRIHRSSAAIGALINSMGYYDPNNMNFVSMISKAGLCSVFLDVGANIGIYSLIAAYNGAKCFAFEPHPFTYKLFMENVELNGLQDRIFGYQIALGAKRGKTFLTDKPGSSTNQIVDNGTLYVEMRQGKEIIQELAIVPDAIKIDVEGYENDVLLGFENTVQKVKFLFIEVKDMKQTKKILEKQGFYGPYKVNVKMRCLSKTAYPDWEDWLFVNSKFVYDIYKIGFSIYK